MLIRRKLSTSGEMPDLIFRESIGGVRFQDMSGVSVNGKHFYLADRQADKVYVWNGVPGNTSNPQVCPAHAQSLAAF